MTVQIETENFLLANECSLSSAVVGIMYVVHMNDRRTIFFNKTETVQGGENRGKMKEL